MNTMKKSKKKYLKVQNFSTVSAFIRLSVSIFFSILPRTKAYTYNKVNKNSDSSFSADLNGAYELTKYDQNITKSFHFMLVFISALR